MSAGPQIPTDKRAGAPGPAPTDDPGDSVAELLSRLGDDVTVLFRQEVELAKAEVRRETTRAARAGAMLGAAAVLGFVALLLLAWTVAWVLAAALPTWLGFLIATLVFGAAAGALAMVGKGRMSDLDFTPKQTIETLEQDKQVITERKTS